MVRRRPRGGGESSTSSNTTIYVILLGLGLMIGVFIYVIMPPLDSMKMTQAVLVGYEDCIDSQQKKGYKEIYRFEHEGKEYTTIGADCLEVQDEISEVKTILYDGNNPEDMVKLEMILNLLGIYSVSLVFGIFMIVMTNRDTKKKSDSSHAPNIPRQQNCRNGK